MKIIDANIILRYLLEDNEELSKKATNIIENMEILISYEVIAEVVYVLEKVYKIERKEIKECLFQILNYNNIKTDNNELLKAALLLPEVCNKFVAKRSRSWSGKELRRMRLGT